MRPWFALFLLACRASPEPLSPPDTGADTAVADTADSDPPDAPCGVYSEVSLADAELTLTGPQAGDAAGNALAVGDVDGDAVGDLLIGAELTDDPTGAAYLVRGPATPGSLADADLVVHGTGGYWDAEYGGFSVALVDLDGDGLDDVASGEPSPGFNWNGNGLVAVASGLREGSVTEETYEAELVGEYDGDLAGTSLAAADVDGDGARELIVGALWYPGMTMFGRVYVVRAPVSGVTALGDAWATLTETNDPILAGYAVTAGDLDGDGSDDVVVGASGRVYGVTAMGEGDIALSEASVRIDADVAAAIGTGLQVDDIDGDGVADLAVGAPGQGAVAVFRGPVAGTLTLADAALTIDGADPASTFGWKIQTSDVDADGQRELVVGAPGASAVWLLCPPASGTVAVSDAARAYAAAMKGSQAGFALAVGEATGDGRQDLIIGVPGGTTTDGGSVVFLGEGL